MIWLRFRYWCLHKAFRYACRHARANGAMQAAYDHGTFIRWHRCDRPIKRWLARNLIHTECELVANELCRTVRKETAAA